MYYDNYYEKSSFSRVYILCSLAEYCQVADISLALHLSFFTAILSNNHCIFKVLLLLFVVVLSLCVLFTTVNK